MEGMVGVGIWAKESAIVPGNLNGGADSRQGRTTAYRQVGDGALSSWSEVLSEVSLGPGTCVDANPADGILYANPASLPVCG